MSISLMAQLFFNVIFFNDLVLGSTINQIATNKMFNNSLILDNFSS